jgi:branched-chain amino acid transport system ATP-binding protein
MLETRGLTRYFKGLRAVSNINLNVGTGEIVGIIGPNGAGKTTIFNLITGFLKPTSGEILFEGKDITNQKPHVVAERGIVRTFQLDRIFHDFTVLQNLVSASHLFARIGFWEATLNTARYRKKEKSAWDHAIQILHFLELEDKKDEIAQNLSHGHQKMLGIAIAMSANPKLLLLDEPLAGMNASEVSRGLGIIARIRERGTGVLLIEHNMRAVMSICDWIVVLNFGEEIARGLPEEVQRNQEVIKAYLGAGEHVA